MSEAVDINALMARCVAEQQRWYEHPRADVSEDFKIIYYPDDHDGKPWRVGFYSGHQGKVVFDAATLGAALTGWLEENEHSSETLS